MITYKQLTLAEIFENCQEKFDNDKYQFLSLLDEAINLDEIVPVSFVSHFYARTGRPRKHQLYPMLKALLIQRIFSIPTDTLLIIFLKYSQELRDFCGFDVVPDASKFTRFKQDFLLDLQSMFDCLVDLTEPICQKLDPSLPMRREGSKSHLRSKLPTMKFVCPKMKWEYNPADKSKRRVCHSDNPCTTSSCGRMIYIYPEKNLRAYPGVERGSKEWEDTYKIRVNVEKSINHFKDSFCTANRKTQNEKTLHADLLLAGITQLVTVLVADKIHQHQYIRSLKPLIA